MMNRMTARLCFLLLFLVFAAPLSAAQARPGDLIIAHQSGPPFYSSIVATTPGSNTMSTVAVFQPTSLRGVMVGADNTHYYAVARLEVYKATPAGVITTLLKTIPVGNFAAWNDLDEDGEILVGTGFAGRGGLMRIHPTSGVVTSILMTKVFPLSFCLDRESGDIVMGDGGTGTLMRIRRDGRVTSVSGLNTFVYSMDFHHPTGDVLIGSTHAIYRLNPLNQLSTFATIPFSMKALAVFGDGSVAAGGNNVPAILHYDARGGFLGTVYSGTIHNVCMVVEDEHNLWGLNAPHVGGVLNLSLRFAAHPGKSFVAAAALSPRPGIRVDQRTIYLSPDALFQLSLQAPWMFVNFAGVLDPKGRASPPPYVLIPKVPSLRGLRIFLGAVVLDPAAPSGIAAISQPYGVTIQ